MVLFINMQSIARFNLQRQVLTGCWCRLAGAHAVMNGRSLSQLTKVYNNSVYRKDVDQKLSGKLLRLSALCGCSRLQHTNQVQNSQMKSKIKKKQRPNSVVIRPDMTVTQLADEIGVRPGLIADILQEMGEQLDHGHQTVLSTDVAELLLMDFEISPILPDDVENKFSSTSTCSATLVQRPPVVTIMGHVDHGKTTLLDSLRKTSVAAGEAGGITQHIGAFSVELPSKDTITFIDTPGHAAFNTMRSRGANVTDIVVLVVAADDGIKAQSVESIKHANLARVPIIVAINKVDKPRVNVSRVKQQLLQHGIQLEEFGGDVQAVEISALKGTNLDSLTEAIITQCELLDLKGEIEGPAQGVVMESKTERGRGPVATVLVQNGTLKKGSIIVAGTGWAKVRQMFDDKGQTVSEAPPSMPVEVLGWRSLPLAGDVILQVESEHKAQELATIQQSSVRQEKLSSFGPMPTFPKDPAMKRKGLPGKPRVSIKDYDTSDKLDIVIKGDVHGSVEAILDALKSYKSDSEIKLSVLHSGVGPVAENDVKMAEPFKGMVFGFNVKVPKDILALAKQLGVQVKTHQIIYKLLEDLKDELSTKLPPAQEEVITGEAVVLQVFKLTGSKKAVVAGCRVKQGNMNRNNSFKLVRDGVVIHEGKLSSMKCKQEGIDVAKKETECGITFEKFSDFQEGDKIQSFTTNQLRQEISWNWGF